MQLGVSKRCKQRQRTGVTYTKRCKTQQPPNKCWHSVLERPTPSVAFNMLIELKSTQALLGQGTSAVSKCTACFAQCATRRRPFLPDKSQHKTQQFFRHRTNKCLHGPIAQAAAVHSPQSLSELDRILCSSEPDAEAKALDLINKLKEDGVVKAYGGAQQIPKRLYTLEELRLNNLRPEEFLSPEDSTLNTVRTILQAGGLAGVTAIFFAFHLTVSQALGLVVAVMFVVVGDQVGNNGGIEGLVVDTAGRYLNKTYAQRIALHEAGHFLIAYLVGLLPKVYTLSTLDAVQRYGKFNIQAGTQFCDKSFSEEIAKGQISSTSLDRYTCVALAGVSAEYLKFGRAEGGLGDVQQLDALLRAIGFTQKKTDGQIRWAVLNVSSLLRRHSKTHEKLAHAMAEGSSVAACIGVIEGDMQDSADI